jgi:hypothetical protein
VLQLLSYKHFDTFYNDNITLTLWVLILNREGEGIKKQSAREIYVYKRDGLTAEWRKLHNEGLFSHSLCLV